MKAEKDDDIDEAIAQCARVIEISEASEFDLLQAYPHTYDCITNIITHTRIRTRSRIH